MDVLRAWKAEGFLLSAIGISKAAKAEARSSSGFFVDINFERSLVDLKGKSYL